MRILTWNIARGRPDPAPSAQALAELDADILLLTEFRTNRQGLALVEALGGLGYRFSLYEKGQDRLSGVLAVSRGPLEQLSEPGPPTFGNRWVHFRQSAKDIEFLGIYLNGSAGPPETLEQKQAFWDHISAAGSRLIGRRALILGDLNTGLHKVDEEMSTFRCAASFRNMLESGWFDAFRLIHGDRRAYSWWSTKRGFRLDHAFASPSLAIAVKGAEYVERTTSHVLAHNCPRPWPESLGRALSDHAALVVEIAE